MASGIRSNSSLVWTGEACGLLEETKPVEVYPQTVLMIPQGHGAHEGLGHTHDGP